MQEKEYPPVFEANTIKLNLADGSLIATLTNHIGDLYSASFDTIGDLVIIAASNEIVKLCRKNGSPLATLTGPPENLYAASFDSVGDLIIAISREGRTERWTIDTRQLAILAGCAAFIGSASFNKTGDMIVTSSNHTRAKTWKKPTPLSLAHVIALLSFPREERQALFDQTDKVSSDRKTCFAAILSALIAKNYESSTKPSYFKPILLAFIAAYLIFALIDARYKVTT